MDKLFTYAFLFFLISLVIYRVKSCLITTGNEKGQISQAWTLYILTILHVLIGIIATVEYFWFVNNLNHQVTILGIILFSMGVAGRFWALNTLGKYHSPQIEIREDQPLITLGPYHYIRHPIYSFTIVEVLGCTLIPNAYFAFCLTIFVYTPLLLLRLFLEEKALIQAFGAAYLKYKETVPCLVPFTKWHKNDMQSIRRMG
jgi:protein-S-isoprenylcysteine O-methyltransferase Ste14